MKEGWIDTPPFDDEVTRIAGGLRVIVVGSAGFAILFGGLFWLALRAEMVPPFVIGLFCVMAVGNALSAIGLTTRWRCAGLFGTGWHLIAFFLWFCAILVAQGISGSPRWLVAIGFGLTLATLFHAGAAIYLAYGRRPNLRYRDRVPDPRYWGPHWVLIETPRAFAHPEGRFGGKLWFVFCFVFLSMFAEMIGVWTSPGPVQIIGVALHLIILFSLVLRVPLAWPLTLLWAALSLLRGIAVSLISVTVMPISVIWLGFGLVCASLSVWVLFYMTEAVRPNLVYRRRYRRLLDGEVF